MIWVRASFPHSCRIVVGLDTPSSANRISVLESDAPQTLPPPNDSGVPYVGHLCALSLERCVLAKDEGMDPPNEVILVTHPHAEDRNLLKE